MVFMLLAGTFNCGPSSLLSSSVPLEIVEKHMKQGAVSTVALVNGLGSLGGCIEGPVLGWVVDVAGWPGMFYFMIGIAFLATLALRKASVMNDRHPKHLTGVE